MQFKRVSMLTFILLAFTGPAQAGTAPLKPPAESTSSIMTIPQMAAALKTKNPPLPVHVGFEFLYKQAHIPGSLFMGEGGSPEARANIMRKLKSLPNNRTLVLYCGCCPWDDCPNVDPLYQEAKTLKGKTIKLLEIPGNFEEDWTRKGYPVKTGK